MSLTSRAISTFLSRGELPPQGQSLILKVLGSKILSEADLKYRLAVSDGQDRFNSIVMILPHPSARPKDHDVLDFNDSYKINPERPDNQMINKEGRFIWIVHNFKNLSLNSSNPATPVHGTSNGHNSASTSTPPHPPVKRHGEDTPGPSLVSAKRSLFNNQVDKATLEIKALNPYQNKYTIRARVTHKGELRSWSNSRGQGKVFNVTLEDKSGDIQATGFNDQAEKFHPLLEVGKVYYLSHAQVKPIHNRAFNQTSHTYELTLNQNSLLVECLANTDDVPTVSYQFTPIHEITFKSDKDTVDVVGVCSQMSEIREVIGKSSGKTLKKRDVTLMDENESTISLTLWEDQAQNFDGLHKVVSCKNAVVSDFNGKSLSISFKSRFEIENLDLPEAQALRTWFDVNNMARKIPMASGSAQSSNIDPLNDEFVSFGMINLEFKGAQINVRYYNVDAFIVHLNGDKLTYQACSGEGCKAKVTESGSNTYFCKKCGKSDSNFKYRYLMRGNAVDMTDNQWFTAFDEVATEIMGLSASALMALKTRNEAEFVKKLDSVRYERYLFRVKCNMETYNDENRLKMVILKATKVDPGSSEHIQRLRNALKNA